MTLKYCIELQDIRYTDNVGCVQQMAGGMKLKYKHEWQISVDVC